MLKSLLYTGPSLQNLHATYAKQGRIDTAAAIQSHAEILIYAPVAPDATFTWKSGPSTIKSTFAVVEPEKELTWTGISFGAKAVDRHTLEATDGGTRLFTEESMAGPFVILFFNSQKLRTSQQAFLAALKQLAEKTS